MRASHDLSRVSTSFDEHNIVPNAGLLPAAVLAQRIDLAGLIDRRLHLAKHGANGGAKALSVIGSMLAGGDSIDDVAVLRTGAAASLFDATRAPSTGAASFLTETISRVRGAGGTGQLTVRADSAFYSRTVIATAAELDVRFSITARQDKRVRAAIAAIDEAAWAPIPYWLSTPEVSGADIAETTFTVFAGDKRHARQVRLVVRRVAPTPGSQLALFTTWDYHAFITDRDLPLDQVEADHRRHAVVEQTIAELKSAGLAHLPSGKFTANAAWLALAVMAHNLGRAVGHLAGPELDTATAASLRRKIFTMPGRLVHSGRRRHLRLPASWPWADPLQQALTRIAAIPMRC